MGRCSCSPRSPRSWRPTSPRPCGPQGVHRLPPAAPAVHHPDGPRLPGTALGLQHRLRPPAHLARGLHRRPGGRAGARGSGSPRGGRGAAAPDPGTDIKVLEFPIPAHLADRYRAGRVFLVGTPPTPGRRPGPGRQHPASRTPTTWPGSSPRWSRARPGRDCWTPTTRSGGAPGCSPWTRRWPASARAWRPGQGPEVLDSGAVAMGYQYRSSAVVGATDGDPRPLPPVALTGQPGSRAPHLQVTLDHRQLSTLDLSAALLCCWRASTGPGGWRPRPASRCRWPPTASGWSSPPPRRRPPTASGPGSAAGPARRLGRLAQHRPAPRPTTELGGVFRAVLSAPG
jgi:hypothetical protein